MTDIRVVRVDTVDIAAGVQPWPFAQERRAEIEAHFAARRRERPALFNGRVLLMHGHALEGLRFRGEASDTDFASFLAWRDWGFPDPSRVNFFAMGAVCSADGAFLVGVMGPQTANAGRIYFPAGTPDPSDVVAGRVDVEGSMWRELSEETGLSCADLDAQAWWSVVLAGPRIAFIKVLNARLSARDLAERVRAHLAGQPAPELADVRLVRGAEDIDPQMPPFVTAFLRSVWG